MHFRSIPNCKRPVTHQLPEPATNSTQILHRRLSSQAPAHTLQNHKPFNPVIPHDPNNAALLQPEGIPLLGIVIRKRVQTKNKHPKTYSETKTEETIKQIPKKMPSWMPASSERLAKSSRPLDGPKAVGVFGVNGLGLGFRVEG